MTDTAPLPEIFAQMTYIRCFSECAASRLGSPIYLVGSCLESITPNDIDLRCVIADEEFDRVFGDAPEKNQFLALVLSEWFAGRLYAVTTNLLGIDFQFQRQTVSDRISRPRLLVGSPRIVAGPTQ